MIQGEIYLDEVTHQIPRILTLLDRNEKSSTYGCFYRVFWHDKITDIPSAHPQIGLLSLAILYKHKFPGNIYFKNGKIKEWSIAGINFCSKIQNSDGSFDEHYPNEHSYGATSWTLSAILDSYLLLENEISQNDKEIILELASKASKWLIRNHDPGPLTNHIAISAMVLHNMYKITRKRFFLKKSLEKIKEVLKIQSPEGWFLEYGGADLGYLTTSISFLARYYSETKNKKVFNALKKAILFSSYFVYPDCSYSRNIGSRNTSHFHPLGFEIMSKKIPITNNITKNILRGIENGNILTPKVMDDKHFFHLTNEFLLSYIHFSPKNTIKQKLPCESKPFRKYFKHSGFFVTKQPSYYTVVNLKKGGVIRIFDTKKKKLLLNDEGIHGITKNNKRISTQWLDDNYNIDINKENVSLSGRLHELHLETETLSSLKMIISRMALLTLGRSNKISLLIKNLLIKRLITKTGHVPFKFKRELNFDTKQIQIKDIIEGRGLKSINIGGQLFPRYVPASKYFLDDDLIKQVYWREDLAEKLNETGKILFKKNINF